MSIQGTTIISPSQAIPGPNIAPFLVVPPGMQYNLAGLLFTNLSSGTQQILIFKNSLSVPPLFNVGVGIFGTYGVVTQLWAQQLNAGDQLFAVPLSPLAYGYITVEADGYIGTV